MVRVTHALLGGASEVRETQCTQTLVEQVRFDGAR
jgi:hypothetical protein